ncbi:MAG TPA: SusC/RagA family TonB-linked outer membrane protein, partial [Gemmatimonadales bacterium]|nr:SusC/RagA family TonB-linked outer membrane protein [Gemmatimonadales bacterium]
TARLVGYKARSAQVSLSTGSAVQDFTLPDNPLQLGELVVTGAGTVSEVEKLGTGRSSVDSLSLIRSAEPNVVSALAAKAPNVTVVSSSGDPGASTHIQIRGQTTISAGSGISGADAQPLFIVDGVPVDNSVSYNNPTFTSLNSSAAPSNRAIDINPNDIENVEVLKGAASGAIYGSRAGQGVVIITTKRGRPGPTKYSLRSSVSLDEVGRLPEFQTKYGLGTGGVGAACVAGGAVNCAVPFAQSGSWGPEIPAGSPTFDHSGEMFQTGHTFDNALTISGGNDRTTFFLSGGATNQRGIITGNNDKFERISVRFNGSHRVFDNLKVGANIAYVDGEGGFITSRNSTDGLLLGAWRSPPDFNNEQYLDSQFGLHRSYRFPNPGPGSEQVSRIYDNPFFVANESFNKSEVGRTFGGVNAEFTATPWLSFAYTLGADYSNDERTQAWPWSTSNSTVVGVNGVGGVNAGYVRSFQIDHNLTATARYRVNEAFSGSVTVGQNLNSNTYQTRQSLGTGLIAPEPYNLGNTSSQLPPYDFKQTIRLESYFAQVSADLWDQLFLTAAIRNDGASTFGADSRRNWYPKGSAAWTFFRSAEGTNRFLTYGKLRAAYGQSGTQPAPYLLTSVMLGAWNGNDGGWGPAISSQQNGLGGLISGYILPTTDLGPERVKEFETGFDLGLWQDKADIGFTWYRAISSDVILNLPVAGSTGYTQKPANAATMRNAGIEVALNLRPVTTRNFAWDLGFQVATNRNRVTDLAGVQFVPLPISGGTNGLGIQGVAIEGQPLGVYYADDFVRCGRGLSFGGVDLDNTAGHCQGAPTGALYIAADGYPQIDVGGTYIIGDPQPDWTGAVRTSFRVNKFSIGGLLDIRQGGDAHNGTKGALHHFGTSKESQVNRDGGTFVVGETYYDHETVSGPGAGTAVPLGENWYAGSGGIFNGATSQFVEDGSFVKLREVSLGYTFDQPWVSRVLGFSSMELRVAGRNLHTWTNYTGVDPETSLLGAASPLRGVDYFNNPQSRSYVFSLTLNR